VSIPLTECEDVAWYRELAAARGGAAALARRVGLDEQRSGQVALAVSEAASNLAKHAVDGAILLRLVRTAGLAGVEFLALDAGPGMADVPGSMLDGTSGTGTLGIGLGTVARLADVFDLHSLPGRGTVMLARFWPRDSSGRVVGGPAEPVVAGLTRPINGEQVCGDAWAVRLDPDSGSPVGGATATGPDADTRPLAAGIRRGSAAAVGGTAGRGAALLVMLCDGLGHGPMAAIAAQAAVRALHEGSGRLPADVVGEVHRALRGTRGAAVAVARIEPDQGRMLFCGVGNISGVLLGDGTRTSLVSYPGIVGHQLRGLRTFEQPLPPGSALVLHSDGLSERWSADALPGLLQHSPALVAGQLLREAGIRHDDASAVVARGAW